MGGNILLVAERLHVTISTLTSRQNFRLNVLVLVLRY
jgi:hypothetical protein